MKSFYRAGLFLLAVFFAASQLQAKNIALFYNNTYVDTTQEAAYLDQSLRNLGHSVLPFTGIEAADWITALTGADLLVIPELEVGDLNAALSSSARAVIQSYISGGGGLILAGDIFEHGQAFINGIFGWSVDVTTYHMPLITNRNAAQAGGTVFAWGPSSLSACLTEATVLTTTLPAGALNLYSVVSGVEYTSVFAQTYGSGKFVYLAFDWYIATSCKTQWENVLKPSIDYVVKADPKTIAFFFNGAYTDTTREAVRMRNSLATAGHTVQTFTGIGAADWAFALGEADLLVIPELEDGNLYLDLSPSARAVIQSYVSGGGGLILAGDYLDFAGAFMNGIFGWSVDIYDYVSATTSLHAAAAAGTPFEVGPTSLPGLDAVWAVYTTTLPAGALNLYSVVSGVEYTSVFAKTYGTGTFVFLGFDWYDDSPITAWEDVLNRAVQYVAGDNVVKNDFNSDGREDLLWRYYASGGYNAVWYLGISGDSMAMMEGTIVDGTIADMPIGKSEPIDMMRGQGSQPAFRDARKATGGLSEKIFQRVFQDAREAVTLLERGRPGSRKAKRQDAVTVMRSPGEIGSDGMNGFPVMEVAGLSRIGAASLPPVTDLNWRIGGSGDFNGDGKVDILWRYYGSGGYNAVWYMDGVTPISAASLPAVTDLNWQIAGTGDFNRDGKVDILWRNYVAGLGYNAVWYMDGVTPISAVSLDSVGDVNWQIAATGDFNGDGKPDIVWRYNVAGLGYNVVWYMNGVTLSGAEALPTVTDLNWQIGGTGDINRDGKVDILWRYYSGGLGYNAVWYMDKVTLIGVGTLPTVSDVNWRIENR